MNFKTITKLTFAVCAMLNMHDAFSAANDDRVILHDDRIEINIHTGEPDLTNQEKDTILRYAISEHMNYQGPRDYPNIIEGALNELRELEQTRQEALVEVHDNQNVPLIQAHRHFITKLKKYAAIGFGAGFLTQTLVGNNSNKPKTIAMLQMVAPIVSAHLYTTRVAIPNNDALGYSRIVDTVCPAIVGSAAGTLGALALNWLTDVIRTTQ